MNFFNIIDGHFFGTQIVIHVVLLIIAFIFFIINFWFTKPGSTVHIVFGIFWLISIVVGVSMSFFITSLNMFMEMGFFHIISAFVLTIILIGIISLIKKTNKNIHKYCFLITNLIVAIMGFFATFDDTRIIKKLYIIFTHYL